MTDPRVSDPVQPWLRRLIDARARGATLGVDALVAALRAAGPAEAWIARVCFDEATPYGRRALVAEADLELMVAGWSRGRACAPHDHGPGEGAVRVLQGVARHRTFTLAHGVLRAEADELHEVGSVLACPRGFIHQMQDAGAAQPLVTLHLYAGSTVPMAVYDLPERRTQWLGPGCGAWARAHDDPAVLRCKTGFVAA